MPKMNTDEEVDLTTVPETAQAKDDVFASAVTELQELIVRKPAVIELMRFHIRYAVLGHRRLGRLYSRILKGEDPMKEEADGKAS